jgi:predicted metal-dependent enzyme (double-stranded beta helix superfamily)
MIITMTTIESLPPQEPVPEALKRFIWDIQSMVELADGEREILLIGRDLMTRLVANDGWLPTSFAEPDPQRPRRYQLYRDDQERFTVAVTILAGGQTLPAVRDDVWQIIGILRGPVERRRLSLSEPGTPAPKGAPDTLPSGAVDTASAKRAETIELRNTGSGTIAVSVHVYGGEIGQLTYANDDATPTYDILTIQTRIVD